MCRYLHNTNYTTVWRSLILTEWVLNRTPTDVQRQSHIIGIQKFIENVYCGKKDDVRLSGFYTKISNWIPSMTTFKSNLMYLSKYTYTLAETNSELALLVECTGKLKGNRETILTFMVEPASSHHLIGKTKEISL